MNANVYLVPHDFTAVGDSAFNYANFIGRKVKTKIILLHVVASNDKVTDAIRKLDQIVAEQSLNKDVEVVTLVKVGNIFECIPKIAKDEHVQLIIMGTHGSVGLQKILGSHAMKIITSINIPYLIVQKDTIQKPVEKIVVPIDMTKESLQIINLAGDIANMYDAEIHVVAEKQNDEIFLQKMKNRILIVKNQLEERKIKSFVSLFENGGSYSKKVINYAKSNGCDFIGIAYHSEALLPQFNQYAQNLITNDLNIPCLIINAKDASNSYF